MEIFLVEVDGKVALVGKYPRDYARVQAVFENWEMARRVFPLAKVARIESA